MCDNIKQALISDIVYILQKFSLEQLRRVLWYVRKIW